jgi:hypothetical protein
LVARQAVEHDPTLVAILDEKLSEARARKPLSSRLRQLEEKLERKQKQLQANVDKVEAIDQKFGELVEERQEALEEGVAIKEAIAELRAQVASTTKSQQESQPSPLEKLEEIIPKSLLASQDPELAAKAAQAKGALDEVLALVKGILAAAGASPSSHTTDSPPTSGGATHPPEIPIFDSEDMEDVEPNPSKRPAGPPTWLEDGSLPSELADAIKAVAPWKKRRSSGSEELEEDKQDL